MTVKPQKRISPANRVAYAGLLTALSCVLLYLAYLFPYLRLTMLFVLSLLPVALASERRYADPLLSFIASAILSGLLFPAKDVWLLYTVFFGWYGIAREIIVQKMNRVWSWVTLVALFNTVFFALYFLARQLLPQVKLPNFLLIPVAEVAFVLFENLFGLCRDYYSKRIRKLVFRQ